MVTDSSLSNVLTLVPDEPARVFHGFLDAPYQAPGLKLAQSQLLYEAPRSVSHETTRAHLERQAIDLPSLFLAPLDD